MPTTRETNLRSVKTELCPRADQERYLFPLILRFCFCLELSLIFLFLVFKRILVFACLNYSTFMKCPSAFRSTAFQWWQDELFKSTDNTRVLLFTFRPTYQKIFFKSTAPRVFGTVYLKMSQKIVTKQKKSFVSIAV